jgi:hypothetical protein
MNTEELNRRFSYHPPKGNQAERYENLRAYGRELAVHIDILCPDSREKSLAMTALEEAIMWAIASIARNELWLVVMRRRSLGTIVTRHRTSGNPV